MVSTCQVCDFTPWNGGSKATFFAPPLSACESLSRLVYAGLRIRAHTVQKPLSNSTYIHWWSIAVGVLAGGRTRSSNTQPTKAWSPSESGAVSVVAWWCTNAPTSRGDSPGINGATGYGTMTGSMQGTVTSDASRNDVPGSVCKPGWS